MSTLCLLVMLPFPPSDDSTPLNSSVLAFARTHQGQRVGDGDCASLIQAALEHAGASAPAHGPYGTELPSLRQARPGDILELTDVVLLRRHTRPDGAILTTTATMKHHFAILTEVRATRGGFTLGILHQNISDQDPNSRADLVQPWRFHSSEIRRGSLRAYRPTPPPPAPDDPRPIRPPSTPP